MEDQKYFLEIRDNMITYAVVRSKRKTIGITVHRNGEVKVSAPFRISEKQIREIVQKKAAWIVKKINEVREMNSNTVCREFISGEKFLYLGKEYTLKVVEKHAGKAEVLMQDDTIAVYVPQGLPEENRKQVIMESLVKWYRQCFDDIIKERIEKYSLQLKVNPCKVAIKDQKTRWGSCSRKGNINLNWRLVMAPMSIIDYVIVHELCHLRIMNHSKDFWDLVKSILPNYSESRKWLKVNGCRLTI